jgi:hypothetical protein
MTISPFEHQKGTERNVMRYNKFNGVLRRNFGQQMGKDLQIRSHNVTAKPTRYMAVNAGHYVRKTETELTVRK